MTTAEASKRYREKRKLDPVRQAHSNEMSKLRMRRARERNPEKYKSESSYNGSFHRKRPWYKNAFRGKHCAVTPKWANREKILEIYKEAYEQRLEVDHIIPLNNDLVCGLHVEGNLQIITSEENLRKGNSFRQNATLETVVVECT